jgi:hypothetical protein
LPSASGPQAAFLWVRARSDCQNKALVIRSPSLNCAISKIIFRCPFVGSTGYGVTAGRYHLPKSRSCISGRKKIVKRQKTDHVMPLPTSYPKSNVIESV